MTPLQEIEAEHARQISEEGWTLEHDDQHDNGEMLRAAVMYMQNATGFLLNYRQDGAPSGWPWDAKWWKPKDPHRDLVRAGALCLAERERLVRAGKAPIVAPVDYKLRLVIEKLGRLERGVSIAWEDNLP